jgi:hypothetical protein
MGGGNRRTVGSVFYVTQGAKETRAWLAANDMSVPDFCEQNDLNRIEVQRCLRGERQRTSVDLAVAISRATGGAVSVEAFSHSKHVLRLLRERRKALTKRKRPRRAA